MTTGSFFNNLYGASVYPDPEVGMGATVLLWTDRHAATVVEATAKTVTVREDEVERVDDNGMSDAQEWRSVAYGTGSAWTFTLRKNGAWVLKGEPLRSGTRLLLGVRKHYYDYSF